MENRRDHHTLGDMDSKVKSMYLQLYQREWSQAYAHQKHGGVAKNTAHGNLLNIILVGSEIIYSVWHFIPIKLYTWEKQNALNS